ncbi:MAG: phosphotransferase family protein [Acidimicrobiales bacterium]
MTESIAGVDLEALAAWMDRQHLGSGPLSGATQLTGGTQNILVRFVRDETAYVLRRPPVHKRDNSDETMRREARILRAIADSEVPHPALIAAEPELDTMDCAFYLMEAVDGRNVQADGLSPTQGADATVRRRMGLAMVDAAVALGALDHEALGMADFGRPDGWLERQVDRWRSHLDGYSAVPEYTGRDEIPHVDDVASWLEANRPTNWSPGLRHGDFHFGNVLFEHDTGELAAVVDWELATVGDPLMDLGWLHATWPDPELPGITGSLQPWDGFASIDDLNTHYAGQSTRDLSSATWYGVMACYKMGIILEGTHMRAQSGKASKEFGDLLHSTTIGLFERATVFIRSC